MDLRVRDVLWPIVVHHMKHDGNQKVLVRAGKRLGGKVSRVVFERQPPELLAPHPLRVGEAHVVALLLVLATMLCLTHPAEQQQRKKWPNAAEWIHERKVGQEDTAIGAGSFRDGSRPFTRAFRSSGLICGHAFFARFARSGGRCPPECIPQPRGLLGRHRRPLRLDEAVEQRVFRRV